MVHAPPILRKAALAPLMAAVLLSGCAGTLAEAAPASVRGENAPVAAEPNEARISGLDDPTTPADLPQTASVLEVERYRPSYRLEGCERALLPKAEPGAELASAIAAAQAYSDEQRGLGLIIMHKGAIVHEGFAAGVTRRTPSASASMMKSVIALLYGIALDDGVIGSIDDPVGQYLPEWRDDPRGAITLRQLMTMSAGLGQSDFMEILLSPDIGKAALAIEKVAEPDTVFSYNNAITKLLTLVLDRQLAAQGKGTALTYLEDQLWCPLGNGDARVWIDMQRAARGYAGLHAGLIDYARIGEMIRNDGMVGEAQVVPPSWIAQMATPSAVNPQYGLQIWLGREYTPQRAYSASNPIKVPHSEPFAAQDIIYFDGFGGQRVYIVPSKELVIARIGEVNLQYDDAIIPNLLIRALD